MLRNPLQLYLAVALIYIAINSCLSGLAGYLEGRHRHTVAKTPVAPTTTGVETGMGTL